jgi:internalin A
MNSLKIVGATLSFIALAAFARADEAKALAAVEGLGGAVRVDARRPGRPVIAVDLSRTPVTDAKLKELEDLRELQVLDLSRTAVTDRGVTNLKRFERLGSLNLKATQVTDKGIKELVGLKCL